MPETTGLKHTATSEAGGGIWSVCTFLSVLCPSSAQLPVMEAMSSTCRSERIAWDGRYNSVFIVPIQHISTLMLSFDRFICYLVLGFTKPNRTLSDLSQSLQAVTDPSHTVDIEPLVSVLTSPVPLQSLPSQDTQLSCTNIMQGSYLYITLAL